MSYHPVSLFKMLLAGLALAMALFAVAWTMRDNPDSKPYLKILGAGFVFNYRMAEASYGFTAAVARPLSVGSLIEATFEDPGGSGEHRVRARVGTMTTRYALHSPAVKGIDAGKPYRVSVRVLERDGQKLLWSHEFAITSQISDSVMPDKPLTVGPGYHRPVENR